MTAHTHVLLLNRRKCEEEPVSRLRLGARVWGRNRSCAAGLFTDRARWEVCSSAECRLKLFAVTIRQLRLMEQVRGRVPQNCFVDGVNHLLAASGQLMVRDKFLAGSMQHFSMRCGKVCEAHLKINFLGTLLPEGRSVEHCVQTDPPM